MKVGLPLGKILATPLSKRLIHAVPHNSSIPVSFINVFFLRFETCYYMHVNKSKHPKRHLNSED